MVRNYLLKPILNCIEEGFKLEGELILVVDYRLHDSQEVDSGWYQDSTVDVDPAVKHVYERVEHHAEVELSTVLGLLEHVEPEIVRCQGCHSDCHGHCGIGIPHLTHHQDVLQYIAVE